MCVRLWVLRPKKQGWHDPVVIPKLVEEFRKKVDGVGYEVKEI